MYVKIIEGMYRCHFYFSNILLKKDVVVTNKLKSVTCYGQIMIFKYKGTFEAFCKTYKYYFN
uniref:Unkown protein n=1 Tax=Riptortus pedestris TaxID=329032 RepID=R4WE32_RIPPE|nr:unkown protein [Riptortus pedestris]